MKPLEVEIPKGKLTVVTGVSGSGKTTLILESLIPGLSALIHRQPLPGHIRALDADDISQVKLIDATPIGINVRSTVATYANVHDELRKVFARTPRRRKPGIKPETFPTTPENSAAPSATAPASSVWMSSSSRTCRSPVPSAGEPATTKRRKEYIM